MADGHITVRISAAADRSVESVFGSIDRRAQKMRDNLNRQSGAGIGGGLRAGASQAEREAARAAAAAKKAADAQTREAARATREVERNYRQQQTSLDRAARAQDAIFERSARNQMRIRESASRAEARAQARAAREATRNAERQAREEDVWQRKMAYRTAYHGVVRYFPGLAGRAGRLGMDIARGAGVNFDVGSAVGRTVSLEQEAVKLSNSSYMAGDKGPAGQRVDPRRLSEIVRQSAIGTGTASADTMAGLREFVGRTGDLATAQAALPELMRLAKATGTDPADMMKFAGTTAATWWKDLASGPEEAKDRAAQLARVMNIGAASGKLGTVEFEDLAKYGPKLAATAQAFTGDKTKNLTEMLALAQMGLMGGAASPAQATTSVGAMVNTHRTPARMKHFGAAFGEAEKSDPLFRKTFGAGFGLEAGQGKFTSASDLILASIMAAGTDTAKFKGMWANVQGARPIEGLRQRYLEAGGGEAGVAAVRSEFAKYGKTLSDKEVTDSFNASMQTAASKAAQFQENLDKVISEMANNVLPQLSKMAPDILKLVGVLGNVATWVVENPKKAIGLGLAVSIGRAGLESVFREYIERMMRGGGGGFPPLGGGGPGAIVPATGRAAVMGGVSRGLSAGIVGAGAYMGADWLAGQYGASGSTRQTAGIVAGSTAAGAQFAGPVGALVGLASGMLIDSVLGAYTQLKGDNWELFGQNKIAKASTPEEYDRKMAAFRGGAIAQIEGGKGRPQMTATLDPTDFSRTMGDQLRSTTLKVVVTNAKDFNRESQPRVDNAGRAP